MNRYLLFLFLILAGRFVGMAQTDEQRESLLRLADQSHLKWRLERAYAESVARAQNFPIRQLGSDGRYMELQRIENGSPVYYLTDNLNAARTISTTRVWSGAGYGYALSGAGQILRIWDGGGVQTSHQEFAGRVLQMDTPSSLNDHATHVSGTMIAAGVNASAHGMADQATLRAYDFNDDDAEMLTEAAAGMRVSNHSYGIIVGWRYNYFGDGLWAWFGNPVISATTDYNFGFYSSDARSWDNIAVSAPYYLICKSGGNDRGEGPSGTVQHWVQPTGSGGWTKVTAARALDGGTTGFNSVAHATVAKNVLSIGAVNDLSGGYGGPGSVVGSSFHGWGPTDDGRIKPDIVTNGINLTSAFSGSPTSYGIYSGTSQATPGASGSIGLLLEHEKNLWGTNSWRSSTIKGLILHTADEAGPASGPDYKFGWGLMNTLKAAQLMTLDSVNGGSFNIREFQLTNGSTIEFNIESLDDQPLRVTICWIDPAGLVLAPSLDPPTPNLVNDLDLRLISATTTYEPWVLDPTNPNAPATTGDNVRDNTEQIHVYDPPPGIYTVRVSHKGGTLSGGSQYVSVILSGFRSLSNGRIAGKVFDDIQGDSLNTPGDPGVGGVNVSLLREGEPWSSVVTDSTGSYEFVDLIAGSYDVVLQPPAGWTQTYPSPADTQSVDITEGTDTSGLDFGQFKLAVISGLKYHDLNDNGSVEENEPGLPGWTMYLSGTYTDSTSTGADGTYEFSGLFLGTYTISEELRPHWRQTEPAGIGTYTVSVTSSGELYADRSFGNYSQRTIIGTTFEDVNGNGIRDSLDAGRPGWMVIASGPTVDTSLTDAQGRYILDGLAEGPYVVSEEPMAGWQQTAPPTPGTHTAVFGSTEETIMGLDFGNFKLGSVSGVAFDDLNSDGGREAADEGIQDWKISLLYNSVLLDSALTDSTGAYSFAGLLAGEYSLCAESKPGWDQTNPIGCHSLTIGSGDELANRDFGQFKRGSVSGVVRQDRNNNGYNDGDPPIPLAWSIVLEPQVGSPDTAVTDQDGHYMFMDLPYGSYTVRQMLDSGWVDTYASGAPFELVITSGLDTSGLDFGNFYTSEAQAYRTARSEDWATSVDQKGKIKAVKRKPDKVDFRFFLVVPAQGSVGQLLNLDFSMDVAGAVLNEAATETLATFSGKKPVVTFSPLRDSGSLVQIVGRGVKGKPIKTKFAWGVNKKNIVTLYTMNTPRLPLPNLHNVGEELYSNGAFGTGLVVGSSVTKSVTHPKYKDILKSLMKSGLKHTGTPRCLSTFLNGKPIEKQQKTLPPNKHSNMLLAEALALKLNVTASVYGMFPNGLGELVYENPADTDRVFNGMSVREIMTLADSVLSCVSIASVSADNLPVRLYDAIRLINSEFTGAIDTFSFAPGTAMSGVKPVNESAILRASYDGVPLSLPVWHAVAAEIPEEFVLHQNYPNPFNPVTTISFSLSSESSVSLKVYNLLGQEVSVLIDGDILDDGEQSIEFDATALPSGVYYYRLTAQRVTENRAGVVDQQVRKMMLVR